jgi:heat shock protein HslJ
MDYTVIKRSLLILLPAAILYSCQQVLYVAPMTMDCTGSSAQKCFLVKRDLEENWVLQYDPIVGMDYMEGFQYKIRARRERIKNPPQDVSGYQLRVTEIMEKKQIYDLPTLLGGNTWRLTAYGNEDEPSKPLDNTAITADFNVEEKKITGNSGCNRFFGSYEAEGSNISFSPMGSTRMACETPLMDQESVFLGILQNVKSFSIEEKVLTLVSEDGRVLTFEPQ